MCLLWARRRSVRIAGRWSNAVTTMAPIPAPRPRPRKVVLAFGLAVIGAFFVAALTGCSLIGEIMQPKTTPAENHEYQRITARNFKKTWTNADVITFTQEGS